MNEEPIVHGEPCFFAIGEERFKLYALPLEKAFVGLDILRASIEPLIGELSNMYEEDPDNEGKVRLKETVTEAQLMQFIVRCVSLTGTLDRLMKVFAPHCDVKVGEALIACDKSTTVFARRTSLAIAWLIKCLTVQYADFLDGSGLATIKTTVKSLISQSMSDQKSG